MKKCEEWEVGNEGRTTRSGFNRPSAIATSI